MPTEWPGSGCLGDQLAAIISDVGLSDDCGSTDVQRLASRSHDTAAHRPPWSAGASKSNIIVY
jgi:hypothetical protein